MKSILILILFTLSACGNKPVVPDKPPPVPANCDATCYEACDKAFRWDPRDPADNASWMELAEQVVFSMWDYIAVCDTRREACVKCLDRLKSNEVIR